MGVCGGRGRKLREFCDPNNGWRMALRLKMRFNELAAILPLGPTGASSNHEVDRDTALLKIESPIRL